MAVVPSRNRSQIPWARVNEMLEVVGLSSAADRAVKTYSLGMRQWLGVAGALLGDPTLLVLDEPANGIDPAGVQWLRRLLRSFAEEGGTVLVSSHLLAEVAQSVDRVLIISTGSGNGHFARAVGRTHPRTAHRDPAAAEDDRAVLVAVAGGGAFSVVTTPRSAERGDALFEDCVHDLEPGADGEREQSFSQLVREIGHRDRDGVGHGDRSVKWTIHRGAVIRSVTRDGA